MMLSNWPGNGGNNEVNVNGVLTSNAVISGRDGASVINVGNAGVLNMLGGLAANTPGRTKNHVINVAGGGRLNAAGGTENQYLKVNLAAGASFGGVGKREARLPSPTIWRWGRPDRKEWLRLIRTPAS